MFIVGDAMMKLSSFFNDVVRGDRNDIFDPPTSKNGKQDDQKGYGDDNSICRLMLEAHTKYPHLARIGLEKMRLHHRLEVVQNLEDNQRKNVLRSIQSDIGENELKVDTASKLSLDELKAVYAYVKNAQLVRVTNPHLFQESSAYDPGTPFYEHYKIDFPSFSELHKVLSLWGCEDGESESETNIGEILAGRIFRLMDTNVDGLLNFKELVQILEILCKADHVKKLKLFYCLHLPGVVLPGELEDNQSCDEKPREYSKNDKPEKASIDVRENIHEMGELDIAEAKLSHKNQEVVAASECEVACDAEQFFTEAKQSLTEMAEGIKQKDQSSSFENSSELSSKAETQNLHRPTNKKRPSSEIGIETSSLRSLVNRIFDSTNSYENNVSQFSDVTPENRIGTEDSFLKPTVKKKLPALPRKNFLHLWRTLHNLFEYNVFNASNLGFVGDNGRTDLNSDNVHLHIPYDAEDSSSGDKTLQDQIYQSITMVGTILLQIGEVGQRVKETQLKEQQNEHKRRVSRSKSGDDKTTTNNDEQTSIDCDSYASMIPASYSCYDILASQQDINSSNDNSVSNDSSNVIDTEQTEKQNAKADQEARGVTKHFSKEKSEAIVDLDDWSITFEQFLASILNESCLVNFFDRKIDILQKLKVRSNILVRKTLIALEVMSISYSNPNTRTDYFYRLTIQ